MSKTMEPSSETSCLGCDEFVEETDIEVVRQSVTSKTKFKKVYWCLCFLSGCSLALLFTSIQMREIITNDIYGMSITTEKTKFIRYPNMVLCPGCFFSAPTLNRMKIPFKFQLPTAVLLGGSKMDPYMTAKWGSPSKASNFRSLAQTSELEVWLKSKNVTFNDFSDTIALKCDDVIVACQMGQRERLNPKQCCGSVMVPEAFFTVFGRCFRFDGSTNSDYNKPHLNQTNKKSNNHNQANEHLRSSASLWHQFQSGPAGGFTLWLNSTVIRQPDAFKDGAYLLDMAIFVTDIANSFRMDPIKLPFATDTAVNVQQVWQKHTEDSTKFRCQSGLEKGRQRCTIEFKMRYLLQKCGCIPYSIASKIPIRRLHPSLLNKHGLFNCSEFSGQNISSHSQTTIRNINHICSPNLLKPTTNYQCENDVLVGRLHVALCQKFSTFLQCLSVHMPSYGDKIWNSKCCSLCERSIIKSRSTSVPLSSDVAQFYSRNISKAMVNNTIRATVSFTSIRKTTQTIFPIGLGKVLPLGYRRAKFAKITSRTLNGQVSLWMGGSIISILHAILFYTCCFFSRKRTENINNACLCCQRTTRNDDSYIADRNDEFSIRRSIESAEDVFGNVLY